MPMKTKKDATLATPKKSTAPIADQVIIEQLRRASGNVAHTARTLGLDRASLSNRIQRTPALRQVVEDARQAIVDAAENALLAAVVEKQGWAVCFALKTLGKDRGYVETQIVQQAGAVEVVIRREDRKPNN